MTYTFIIDGKPIPKARPRFSRVGSFVKTYDCQSKEMKAITECLRLQLPEDLVLKPLDCAISVKMYFHTPIPESWSKKKKEKSDGMPDTRCTGDCDNLMKVPLDCANGLIFRDDCLITELYGEKRYSTNPRTVIEISLMD